MALWLQWTICFALAAASAVYLCRQWGLGMPRRKKSSCGCAKCPLASSTLQRIESRAPRPRRRAQR